jgi:hypothetical protein
MIGVFVPSTDEMQAAVLRLRMAPVPARMSCALSYGLCADHAHDWNLAARVEQAIREAAAQVRVQ